MDQLFNLTLSSDLLLFVTVKTCDCTCLRVPGVTITAYNIHRGTMSVEDSVKNPPMA